jgi:hypothetical protein
MTILSRESGVCFTAGRSLVVIAILAFIRAVLSGYMWYAAGQLHKQGYQRGVMLCLQTDQVDCAEVLLSRNAGCQRAFSAPDDSSRLQL